MKGPVRSGVSASDEIVPVAWFTPFNQTKLAADDLDLGSVGAVILPEIRSEALFQASDNPG
jgi:hypothetical protein